MQWIVKRTWAKLCGIVFAALLSAACVSEDYSSFYYMDLRSYPGPVMVSAVEPQPTGRQFKAIASQSEETISSYSSGGGYSYSYYSWEQETTVPSIDLQILTRASRDDRSVYIDTIEFNSHFLGSFGYVQTDTYLSVEVLYSRK